MKYSSLAFLLLALFVSTSFAKKPQHAPAEPMLKITEVSPASITLSAGHSGETHESYKIIGTTKVTIDGLPSTADALRAGMEARVTPGGDGTASEIHAKDASAHPHRGRVG